MINEAADICDRDIWWRDRETTARKRKKKVREVGQKTKQQQQQQKRPQIETTNNAPTETVRRPGIPLDSTPDVNADSTLVALSRGKDISIKERTWRRG